MQRDLIVRQIGVDNLHVRSWFGPMQHEDEAFCQLRLRRLLLARAAMSKLWALRAA